MARKALIFDFNRTLYDIDNGVLYDGVKELLEEQKALRSLFLYSKLEGGRDALLRDLGIDGYFDDVYFVTEKTPESVRDILNENGLTPEECVIVGDLISSELAAGNEVGLETVWIKQGRFAGLFADFEPTYTVRTISELRELLKTIP